MAYQVPQIPTLDQFAASTSYGDGTRAGQMGPIDWALQIWPPPGAVGTATRTGLLRQIAIACSAYLQANTAVADRRRVAADEGRIRAAVRDLKDKAVLNYKFEIFQGNKRNGPSPTVKALDAGYAHEAPQVYNPPTKRVGFLRGAAVGFKKYKNQTTASVVKDWMKEKPQDPLVKDKVFANLSFDEYARIEHQARKADPYVPILKQYSKQVRIDNLMLIPLPDPNDGNRVKFFIDGFTPFDTSSGGRHQLFNLLDPDQPMQRVNMFIYALDKYGNVYAQESGAAGLHHSSFVRGKEVICAGQIVCSQGKLLMIDNASGHYKPTAANLQEAVNVLTRQGFDFSSGEIEVDIIEPNPLRGQLVGNNNFQALITGGNAFQAWVNRFPPGSADRFFLAEPKKDVKLDPSRLHDSVFKMSGIRRIYGSANPSCAQRATYNAATFGANINAAPLLLEFANLM